MYKFVIHEHHAKKAGLHYDLRLQFKNCKNKNDISLYSFASRKLKDFLTTDTNNRIALFRTPNHECWWLDFEGELKEGYGAGKIYIYDHGNIEWIKDEDTKKVFKLKGKHIDGTFALIKTKYSNRSDTWLIIKIKKVK